MLRQVGLAVGVAIFVAVVGAAHGTAAALSSYQRGWIVIAAASLLAALAGGLLLRTPGRARESGLRSGAAASPHVVPERQ
jgi:hypothetical protein